MLKVFDYVYDFQNDLALVESNKKCNFLTRNGNLLMDKWVDHALYWRGDFCPVLLGNQLNIINKKGEYLLPKWASIKEIRDAEETYHFDYEGVQYTLDAINGSFEYCKGLEFGEMSMFEFLEKVAIKIVRTYTGLDGSSNGGLLFVVKNGRNKYNFLATNNVDNKFLLDEWATSIKACSPEGEVFEPKFLCTFIKDGKTIEKLITAYENDEIELVVSDPLVLV